MTLKDTGIVITGASRGLGRALAFALAKRGARLLLVARGAEALEKTVRELCALGAEAHGVVADVGDKEATFPLAGQANALLGRVDILINNASTLGKPEGDAPLPLLMDTECEDLERVLEVNLVGPFRLTKALAMPMVLRQRGTVVNISSDAAVEAYPGWGAYGASKAALDHLTRIWAAELAESGVRVLSVDPGEMDTEMHAEAMPDADRASLARPEDVAQRLVQLLASDAVTGTRFSLAGDGSQEAAQ